MFFQKAPQTPHYFLCMQTMLLGTCEMERYNKSIFFLNICVLRFELFDVDVFFYSIVSR